MKEPDPAEAMRQAAREVLRELLPEVLGTLGQNGNGNGNSHRPATTEATEATGPTVVPPVPAPPVAAVLRPSTWAQPAAPGEVIGEGGVGDKPARGGQTSQTPPPGPSATTAGSRAEAVQIDTDEDLQRFVKALAARMDNPRDRRLIRSGQVRFTLRRPAGPAGPAAEAAQAGPVMRMEKGAVTERAVRAAAATGARLVLARGAVLTPLARDQARTLRVHIEREGK